jgi:hypothetical protein
MAAGYTAFMTYMFSGGTGATNIYGYSDAIHCNYINKIQFDNLINKEFNIYFDSADEFKFLSVSGGSGYSANKLIVLAQLIDNTPYDNVDLIKPDSAAWKLFDVTDQIIGYVTGQTLSPQDVTSTVFRVPIGQYNLAPYYDLDYLNYPASISGTSNPTTNPLSFGDETYFLGNVTTSIEAIAYTMDLAINLPLNQFNSTNNETWDGVSPVSISEIGLYDANKNLVGIAKLNDPIPKDDTIARTIVFGMDF